MKVAIDGPAGAGKSTVSKALAKKLGFVYVDTGALYRALAYCAIMAGVPIQDAYEYIKNFKVEIKIIDENQRVFVDGDDVTDYIRTPDVTMGASKISAIPEIRQFLFDLQRTIANENSVVMDGRDIGTVILPDAEVKFFLTASPEERANRRFKELISKPACPTYEEILTDIIQRDYDDSHRDIAPLIQSEEAILIDSTQITQFEVIERMYAICKFQKDFLKE